jgi:DNA-binding transcriptional LysR family regulator
MNIRFLETLVWLARLGSFSRTAEKLHTTQPAISSRIATLEDLLGTQLYRHGERRLELTAEGLRVLPIAERIVELADELREVVRPKNMVDMPISIGVIEMVTISWLPDLIRRIDERMPTAKVHFDAGTTTQLVSRVQDGQVDIGFVVGPLDEPSTASRVICTVSQHWVANPKHFDCKKEIDVNELARLPLVIQRSGSSGYDMLIEYFRGYGISNVPPRDRRVTFDCAYSLGSSMELMRHGLVIMALPSFVLRNELLSGALAKLPVRQPLPPFDIVACWKTPCTNPAVGKVVELALEAASDAAASFPGGEIQTP